MDLISIKDAAQRGILRVRMPIWKNSFDHLKIDIIEGLPGPWTHLFSPMNKFIGNKEPVDCLCLYVDYEEKVYLPFEGELPDSEAYQEETSRFDAMR